MMYVNTIHIINYKNHENRKITLHPSLNIITGNNGSGKTNVLDALYYLCITKSFRTLQDASCVRHEQDFFRIDSTWSVDNQVIEVIAKYRLNTKKKEMETDGELIKKMQHHIGKFPVVTILPDDINLINAGSELRRKWVDMMIGQTDASYLATLVEYNKIIDQRNAYFKQVEQWQDVNLAWLDTLDEQLCARASQLFNKRAKAIAEMQEQFNTIHQKLSRHNEYVQLEYVSQCQQGMLIDKIKARQALDFQIKRSTVGTHRDDVQLHIDGHEAKKIASQGQLKTILLAMKLAELQWIKQHTIRTPILLLDDVFDKLDPHRIKELLQVVHQLHVQVFITDTDAARLVKITSENNQKYELIELCE